MDKAKKKRLKRCLTWVGIAAVVAMLTVLPLLAKNEAEQDGPVASILSAQAQTGTVQTALHGGGTLQEQGAQDIKIPADVKITRFLVKNGDYVEAGAPLALVDKVSVMTAITQVDETLKFLREELEDARNEKVDSTITAVAGGRVKKIFAREGESVQDVMLRDGALAILSIDGMMAVKIENDVSVTTGEGVKLQFKHHTETIGRVESSLDGVKVITVEDEGYTVGEEVLVSTLDGEIVGSGSLYIHNAWKATGHTGTVSQIHTKEEAELYAGAAIFTLEDREYTAQLQHRANQHREYEALLQKLLNMYESGTIDAPCEGVVSGVDKDSPFLLEDQEDEWYADSLSNRQEETGYRIILLSNTEADCTENEFCEAKLGDHKKDCPMECTKGIGCPAKEHYDDCITHCDHGNTPEDCDAPGLHYSDCIRSCTKADDCASSKHYNDCLSRCISASSLGQCPGEAHKTSCIEKCASATQSGEVCEADQHHHKPECIYSCVSSTGKNTLCPATNHKDDCYFKEVVYIGYAVKVEYYSDQDGIMGFLAKTQEYSYSSFSALKSRIAEDVDNGKFVPVNAEVGKISIGSGYQISKGYIVLIAQGYKGTEPVDIRVDTLKSEGAGGGMSGTPIVGDWAGMLGGQGGMTFDISGMTGGFAGYGNYSGYMPETQDEGLYDLDGSTLMTVTPVGQMTLEIALDEHDIAKVETGMEAEVQLAAIRGKTYPARISKIGIQGENSGGSSKFTVELTLDSTMEMLSGMSATACIPLETYENVLTIPVSALSEEGAKTVIYTTLNEDTGLPATPKQVETGISDGDQVEILTGLEPGDTVYYSYYDTLELDTSAEAERFTFG